MNSEQKTQFGPRLLVGFFIISLFFVFLTGYTKYIFAKDYTFYVEGECDPTATSCYVRSCDDYCPPNELSTYSAYYIDANQFNNCTYNDCKNICEDTETAYLCEPIPCDAEEYECTE